MLTIVKKGVWPNKDSLVFAYAQIYMYDQFTAVQALYLWTSPCLDWLDMDFHILWIKGLLKRAMVLHKEHGHFVGHHKKLSHRDNVHSFYVKSVT